jgi:hypothetical protein
VTYNPAQVRNNHGEFGSQDVPLKGTAAASAAVTTQPMNVVPPDKQPIGKPAHEGSATPEEAQAQALKVAGGYTPLVGPPQKPIELNGQWYVPGPIGRLKDAAAEYMKQSGMPYDPPKNYGKLDKERSAKVADAYDKMKDDPTDPAVAKSYAALARETLAQWEVIKKTGLKVEWVKPGQKDPYALSPRLAAMDVSMNNHWWGYPTDLGYGGAAGKSDKGKDNPMLKPTGEVLDGHPLVVNDVFRIVHDMMGHLQEGNGFRAEGEENAWRGHSAMYSDEARPAMTSETRGQNSWVNYGPYGATNRTADEEHTVFAPQKIGLMPDWTENEGRR